MSTDLERLTALRERLESVLRDPATTPRDLAAVSREFRLLLDTMAKAAPANEKSPLDEIAAKRKKRGA